MQNKHNIGYDQTKKMLNVLRNLNNNKTNNKFKGSLYEQDTSFEKQDNDIMVINDVDVNITSTDKSDLELRDEEKSVISQMIDNFYSQVSQVVEFDPGITISENQIRLDGTLTDDDISFVFIGGNDRGLYINTEMLKLDKDIIPILDKLIAFEETYKTSVEPLINKRNKNLPLD
jgi:hypothetical protein